MYDSIAASILHNNPPPHNYIVDIVEKDDSLMYLRLYADNILSQSDNHAAELANWLNVILDKLNTWTTARWTYEMAESPKDFQIK